MTSKKSYIGEYSDSETGLSYLNARYYDPKSGQFLGQDPAFVSVGAFADERQLAMLLDPQLQNSYSYARGNPISMSDASGESPLDTIAGFFVGAGKGAWGMVSDLAGMVVHPVAALQSMVSGIKAIASDPVATAGFLAQYLGDAAYDYVWNSTDYERGVMLGALAINMIGTGKKGFLDDVGRMAIKATTRGLVDRGIYRGGISFILREGEKGISLNIDPFNKNIVSKGGANRIVSLPEGLEIVQQGKDAGHYLITPSDPNISRDGFQQLLNQIETSSGK